MAAAAPSTSPAVAIDAAAAAIEHLASSSTVGAVEAANLNSDTFTSTLKAAHTTLSAEIECDYEPSAHGHSVHEARSRSQQVGLRAGLMSTAIAEALERLDGSGPPP